MLAYKIVFWVSFSIIFYSYIGYGILLYVLVSIKKIFRGKNIPASIYEPSVTLVVAAYNEEDFILKKLRNTEELDYPSEKLQVIFITDGSSDNTTNLISQNSRFELLHQQERRGKVAAMNRAIHFVKAPIVIFCDANTLLNRECVKELVKHYANEKVGAVAGGEENQ